LEAKGKQVNIRYKKLYRFISTTKTTFSSWKNNKFHLLLITNQATASSKQVKRDLYFEFAQRLNLELSHIYDQHLVFFSHYVQGILRALSNFTRIYKKNCAKRIMNVFCTRFILQNFKASGLYKHHLQVFVVSQRTYFYT